MFESNNEENNPGVRKRRPQKKITPQRLKNIGLYYLKRFESSVENLRLVLQRRVNLYARENPDFDRRQAYQWIEEILADFERLHYLDDARYTEIKIRGYLNAGKPARYIRQKLQAKGVAEQQIDGVLSEQEYNPLQMALNMAKRKKIGPYRSDDTARKEMRQKDMGTLVRAGFDYDTVLEGLDYTVPDEV